MRVLSTHPTAAAAAAAAAVLAALAVTACTPTGTATPQPTPPPASTPTTTPTPSPTPDQAELVRQTQAAYQTGFDEFERLSWEGGADQPSPKQLEIARPEDLYLKQMMALLQDQKKTGYTLEGKPSTTKSRSAAGSTKGDSDPRLTLQICEDRRGSFSVNPDGRKVEDRLSQGYVYAKVIDGRVMLVHWNTSEVERCDW